MRLKYISILLILWTTIIVHYRMIDYWTGIISSVELRYRNVKSYSQKVDCLYIETDNGIVELPKDRVIRFEVSG